MESVKNQNSNQILEKISEESFNEFYFNGRKDVDAFSLCTSCGEACDCDCPCDCTWVCDCDCPCE